jgi:hypothetical protein
MHHPSQRVVSHTVVSRRQLLRCCASGSRLLFGEPLAGWPHASPVGSCWRRGRLGDRVGSCLHRFVGVCRLGCSVAGCCPAGLRPAHPLLGVAGSRSGRRVASSVARDDRTLCGCESSGGRAPTRSSRSITALGRQCAANSHCGGQCPVRQRREGDGCQRVGRARCRCSRAHRGHPPRSG